MSFSFTLTRGWSQAGEPPVSTQKTITADSQQMTYSDSIAGETTDKEIDGSIDYSKLVGLFICSTQDMTIKTNSDSAPDQTLTLKANAPILWCSDDVAACPITADVTKIYVTVAGAAAAQLDIRTPSDMTP